MAQGALSGAGAAALPVAAGESPVGWTLGKDEWTDQKAALSPR